MKNLIKICISSILLIMIFTGSDCEDGGPGSTPVPSRCTWVEVDEMAGYTYWNSSVASRTFGQVHPDESEVGVCVVDNVTLGITAVSYSTTQTIECNIQQFLEGKTQRNWVQQGYVNYLFFAKECSIGGGGYLLGKSSRSTFCFNTNNYSFVFCQTILVACSTLAWHINNAMNLVTVHELGGHQISNNLGHGGHNGKNPDYCYINDFENEYLIEHYLEATTEFTQFDICPNHKTALWNGPDLVRTDNLTIGGFGYESKLNSNNVEFVKKNNPDNKLSIVAESSKQTYKMYEPIHVIYQIINTSNEIDTIYQEFVDYHNFVDYQIEGINLNKSYSARNIDYDWNILPKPLYFLQPGDTMLISKRVNFNYGEKFSNQENIFEQNGYLLPGKYKVSSTINTENSKYKTNDVEFEIMPLSDQDNQIIELSRNKHFPNEVVNFEGNELIEPLLAQELFEYYPDYENNYKPSKKEILEKYENFLTLFPDSKYWFNILFVNAFFFKLSYVNSDIQKDVTYIMEKYPESSLAKFLRLSPVKSSIITMTTDLKKALHNK